jgi:hypothetical protein
MNKLTPGAQIQGRKIPLSLTISATQGKTMLKNIKTRLDVLAITPTTAVVRVDMENDAIGADYTDFHTLIKLNGTWHIIVKVYHKYEG